MKFSDCFSTIFSIHFTVLFSLLSLSIAANAQVETVSVARVDNASLSYPMIRNQRNAELQKKLDAVVKEMQLTRLIKSKQIGIALVDISDEFNPKFAGVNGDTMMYAASLPKIAILFGLFKRVEQGTIILDDELLHQVTIMIRNSSNTAATHVLNLVGIEYLANLLQSPEYLLYEKNRGGGLWVGKVYGKDAAWKRDPIHQLSHGASAIKVARFYYLLETNRLVNAELTQQMKSILVDPAINHKFVKGLNTVCPEAKIYRKSGTWRNWHSDSAIVSHGGKNYIAVVLIQHKNGGEWLTKLIKKFDKIIFSGQLDSGCGV